MKRLNAILPVIAHKILESITILARATLLLAEEAIEGFVVNEDHIKALVQLHPMIVAVLSPFIDFDKAAKGVNKAPAQKEVIKLARVETGYLFAEEADRILDPQEMTGSGLMGERI